ncbi:MAG: AAA family ATPase, partial [Kiritimatiellae bacterium]|nr:AAA family ATPase [Kiritimatiellia bacterium]
MDNYINRALEDSIRLGLKRNPVLALLGPRQCGKSTLVRKLRQEFADSLYLDMERPSDVAKLA